MNAFTNESYIDDLHVTQVCFGREMALHPGARWFTEKEADDAEHQRNRQQQETQPCGTRALERQPRQGARQERRGNQIRPAPRMDGESAFTGAQARIRFIQRFPDVFRTKVTENEEAGRVGMPAHVDFVRACQHVQRGVLERVIAPRLEDIGKVKYHDFIIALKPEPHSFYI